MDSLWDTDEARGLFGFIDVALETDKGARKTWNLIKSGSEWLVPEAFVEVALFYCHIANTKVNWLTPGEWERRLSAAMEQAGRLHEELSLIANCPFFAPIAPELPKLDTSAPLDEQARQMSEGFRLAKEGIDRRHKAFKAVMNHAAEMGKTTMTLAKAADRAKCAKGSQFYSRGGHVKEFLGRILTIVQSLKRPAAHALLLAQAVEAWRNGGDWSKVGKSFGEKAFQEMRGNGKANLSLPKKTAKG